MKQNTMDTRFRPLMESPVFLRLAALAFIAPLAMSRQPDGGATIAITGELKEWHKVTLTLDCPFAEESDTDPNPFTDLEFDVTFTHESGTPAYQVPGHFAADGRAAETSAGSATMWRAHLSPDQAGKWIYTISFKKGRHAALDGGGKPLAPYHGKTRTFVIVPTDRTGRDFRAHGRLQYVGKHHLQFAASKRYFLKAGADAPETLLAFADAGSQPGQRSHRRAQLPCRQRCQWIGSR